jgi:hypothetical protein
MWILIAEAKRVQQKLSESKLKPFNYNKYISVLALVQFLERHQLF